MDMTYSLYVNPVTNTAYEIKNGSVRRSTEGQDLRIGNLEILSNKKYNITVDHSSKVIIVQFAAKKSKQTPLPVNFDSAQRLFKSIEFFKKSPTEYGYHLQSDFSEYEKIDVLFNPSNFYLEKLVLVQRKPVAINELDKNEKKDKQRLEISCRNINTSLFISPDEFAEKKYVIISSGAKVKPQPAYKNYTVFNRLKKS